MGQKATKRKEEIKLANKPIFVVALVIVTMVFSVGCAFQSSADLATVTEVPNQLLATSASQELEFTPINFFGVDTSLPFYSEEQNPTETVRAYTWCTQESCKLIIDDIVEGSTYELQGIFLSWRPYSNLNWVDDNTLEVEQWTNPNYGTRYHINVAEQKIVEVTAIISE